MYVTCLFFCYRKHLSVPLKKKTDKDFFKAIRGNINSAKENAAPSCNNCINLTERLKEKNEEINILKSELHKSEAAALEEKKKYKEMKSKYKEKKKAMKEQEMSQQIHLETKKFGSVVIPTAKLALCRRNDYSKYVGDLLDMCFGREVLSESVLKSTPKRTTKTNVLDHDVLNDIIIHVLEKFPPINIAMVRAAIRQKLNTCHKSKTRCVK